MLGTLEGTRLLGKKVANDGLSLLTNRNVEMALIAPLPPVYDGLLAYKAPGGSEWMPLDENAYKTIKQIPELEPGDWEKINRNNSALKDFLVSAFQLPNVGFFAGSGTSLGAVGGPSMQKLWSCCMCGGDGEELTPLAVSVCDKVHYTEKVSPNIEHFLSQCDAFLLFNSDEQVEEYLLSAKKEILKQCSIFIDSPECDISAYQTLLYKLARRRVRDPRLKVFTTNYDMCFETAASKLGMMVVDGFSYTRKRRFDGRHFNYDIVRRDMDGQDFIEGVFQLFKLHGSVSWERDGGEVYECYSPSPEKACLIYPARGKYQQAFIQPHLELLSRFLEFLRQPNSCLFVSGFGFNDDHLSEPIVSAVRSNPSLKLIVSDYRCIAHLHNEGRNGSSRYWDELNELAAKGFDVHFVSGSFSCVNDLIPSLRAVSPAEQLANAVRRLEGE